LRRLPFDDPLPDRALLRCEMIRLPTKGSDRSVGTMTMAWDR
jgi:hypothetical protein